MAGLRSNGERAISLKFQSGACEHSITVLDTRDFVVVRISACTDKKFGLPIIEILYELHTVGIAIRSLALDVPTEIGVDGEGCLADFKYIRLVTNLGIAVVSNDGLLVRVAGRKGKAQARWLM